MDVVRMKLRMKDGLGNGDGRRKGRSAEETIVIGFYDWCFCSVGMRKGLKLWGGGVIFDNLRFSTTKYLPSDTSALSCSRC